MCDHNISFYYWPFSPYVDRVNGTDELDGVILGIFNQSFVTCCRRPMDVVVHERLNQGEVLSALENKDQAFAMPIMVSHLAIQNVPQIFVRVLDHPGLTLITLPPESTSNVLLSGLKNVWPLLAALIILSGYASLVFWIAEYWSDTRAFSRKFHYGYFQAFWYCLISATTVGSRMGKVCGVVWILLGVCIVSAFTASITTLMAQMQYGLMENVDLTTSNNVGVIDGTVDQYMVVQAGTTVVTANNLEALSRMIQKGNDSDPNKVQAIAIDPHHLRVFSEDYFSTGYITQPKVTGPVSVGYLVKVRNDSTLRCFKQQAFFRQLEVNDRINKFINNHEPHKNEDKADFAAKSILRDKDKEMLLIATAVLVGLFFVIWLAESLLSPRTSNKTPNYADQTLSATNTSTFNDMADSMPLGHYKAP